MNIGEFRGGQRSDMWLPLQDIKMGRLHLAITVIEDNAKVKLFSNLHTTAFQDYLGQMLLIFETVE